jgi:hypothetical protein
MVRPFDDADRPAIRALLETAGLPVPHPDEVPVRFWVAAEQDRIVGCAGTEDHGDFTLIRRGDQPQLWRSPSSVPSARSNASNTTASM